MACPTKRSRWRMAPVRRPISHRGPPSFHLRMSLFLSLLLSGPSIDRSMHGELASGSSPTVRAGPHPAARWIRHPTISAARSRGRIPDPGIDCLIARVGGTSHLILSVSVFCLWSWCLGLAGWLPAFSRFVRPCFGISLFSLLSIYIWCLSMACLSNLPSPYQ